MSQADTTGADQKQDKKQEKVQQKVAETDGKEDKPAQDKKEKDAVEKGEKTDGKGKETQPLPEKKKPKTGYRLENRKEIEINRSHGEGRGRAQLMKEISFALFGHRRFKRIEVTCSLNSFFSALKLCSIIHRGVAEMFMIVELQKVQYTQFEDEEDTKGTEKDHSLFRITLTKYPTESDKSSYGFHDAFKAEDIKRPFKLPERMNRKKKDKKGDRMSSLYVLRGLSYLLQFRSLSSRPPFLGFLSFFPSFLSQPERRDRYDRDDGRDNRRDDRRRDDRRRDRRERDENYDKTRRNRDDVDNRGKGRENGRRDQDRYPRGDQERDYRKRDRRQSPRRERQERRYRDHPRRDREEGSRFRERDDDRRSNYQAKQRRDRDRQQRNDRGPEQQREYKRGEGKSRGAGKVAPHQYDPSHIRKEKNEQDRGDRKPRRKNRYSDEEW